MEASGDVNKGDGLPERKAAGQTSAPGAAVAPRRGLRERPAARTASGDSSVRGSGRVLRDRSTRAVPAWLKDDKSDDEDRDERRRKVPSSRRRKAAAAAAADDSSGSLEAGDAGRPADEAETPAADARVQLSRLSPAQSGAEPPPDRTLRCAAAPPCKTELATENPAGERPVDAASGEATRQEKPDINGEEKRQRAEKPENPRLQGDPDVLNAASASQPQGRADEEEVISSDEDVPFRDDLKDQSYDPKGERFSDAPKPKRRIPLRQKDKKEKEKAPKKEEVEEVKTENLGIPETEVKLEEDLADGPDGPRKRGRRKKDDKTPRLPKRRKKPPVQYVRCEMEGCGTVLAHPRYLQHHIKYQHLLKKKYVCPHPSCGRLFRLQKQLLRHAKHHTDQRDYICEFCARAFKSSHNLAVHRMIHTGEKPLQCEICGFTCRQKASLNWHMKKHDADASYQFSCSICGKKFEKKDCVVAHKAKSHPEVLIAEALAANAGALITTPATLLEPPVDEGRAEPPGAGGRVGSGVAEVSRLAHVTPQVVLLGHERAPVTIAVDPPPPADHRLQTQVHLQMPVQFVQQAPQLGTRSPSAQRQHQHQSRLRPLQSYSSQQQSQGQILQMSFQPTGQQQIPLPAAPLQTSDGGREASDSEALGPDGPAPAPPPPPSADAFRPTPTEGAGALGPEQTKRGDA
ncbi:E3 ubiquitin-protein ligase ZFP91 [Syngnathoides biaculeatus]|uniref:E3 ubiquitin-protein ligase ZFP91 n=1 Tax=Syngnathoides biaculeatus TaxID=300417 RepID=UPI002ADE3246|nr:E3 ubiquitin-protein ligase ZFP91 [Syngnathoides biaculeatus]XP_061685057.1 E3 ubiquitin-protein ligase ZFP91 [Syngnathoides biaculeatus]